MKYIDGDIIKLAKEGNFDVIGHGCNCFLTMGAGLALKIKQTWPSVAMADACTKKGDKTKLGTFTFLDTFETNELTILNLYTQFGYDSFVPQVDYSAIRECMAGIKKRYSGKRIGLPLIGAGLGGGDWNIISQIIEDELGDEDVTIVKFKR